jgi:hypothetical protein
MPGALGFWLRSSLTWSAPAWKRVVTQAQVAATLEAPARARLEELSERYDLSSWSRQCSRPEWRESLYALDVVDRLVPPGPEGRGLDVGAKNGCTLPGLATARPGGWDAVELDAHRRHLWGTTRRGYGEALARAFEGCRFIAGDVRSLAGPYARITWFLPFLSPAPLDAWGVPRRFLVPDELLAHVLGLLEPRGTLLVVNQGEAEAALQQACFERAGVVAEALGRVESPLSPFTRPRFGFRVRTT